MPHPCPTRRSSDLIDMLMKGYIPRDVPETARRVSDAQIAWIDALDEAGQVGTRFNLDFFTGGDSREPELAGIWGAVVGRSEEHTSELQSLMSISYAVFCLKKNNAT